MCHPSSLQIFVPVKVAYLYQSWIGFVSKKGKKKPNPHTETQKKRTKQNKKTTYKTPKTHTKKEKSF